MHFFFGLRREKGGKGKGRKERKEGRKERKEARKGRKEEEGKKGREEGVIEHVRGGLPVRAHDPTKITLKNATKYQDSSMMCFLLLFLFAQCGTSDQQPQQKDGFDIRSFDIVYTWVNSSDPFLFTEMKKVEPRYRVQKDRIQDREEMRYSLRSISKFMPWWHGRLVIVTNHEPPTWLNLSSPRVVVYSHKQLWEHTEQLPTFNSDGIEQHLRRIPNLTDHFVYFNDDMMLANPVLPDHLWSEDGRPRTRFTTNLVKFGRRKHDELLKRREKLWQANVFYTHEFVDKQYAPGKDYFLHHTPYPMLKKVLDHIHDQFPQEVAVPMKCRQRCYKSLQIPSMHHWIATRENLADPIYNSSSLHQYSFVKTNSITNFTNALKQIGTDTLFFNLADYPALPEFHKVVGDFLTLHYPVPSAYELNTAVKTVFEQERDPNSKPPPPPTPFSVNSSLSKPPLSSSKPALSSSAAAAVTPPLTPPLSSSSSSSATQPLTPPVSSSSSPRTIQIPSTSTTIPLPSTSATINPLGKVTRGKSKHRRHHSLPILDRIRNALQEKDEV